MDVEIYLISVGLEKTIIKENTATRQEKAKTMIFLRHHLDEGLKSEYLTVTDPVELWESLKERYDNLKLIILPSAQYDWLHLRIQDFKTVNEYNSAMFKITSQLRLCGEKVTDQEMLEKTFSTFHVSNVLLQQQYRQKGFKKYSELIGCLLLAEKNNELLLKNHENRPTGSSPFPEMNATQSSSRGRGRGRGRVGPRGRGRGREYNNMRYETSKRYEPYQRDYNTEKRQNDQKYNVDKGKKKYEEKCHRCGMEGHWSQVCRTASHWVKLYQDSLKGKGKNVETNLAEMKDGDDINNENENENENENMIITPTLDVADFFDDIA